MATGPPTQNIEKPKQSVEFFGQQEGQVLEFVGGKEGEADRHGYLWGKRP